MLKPENFTAAIAALVITTLNVTPVLAGMATPHISMASMRAFPAEADGPMTPVDGSSMLMRTAEGVAFSLDTRGLEPGAAYTAWWVVFNAPENCATPHACGAKDLDVASVEPGVLYASGRIADATGQARFAANLDYGVMPTGDDQVPNPKRAHAIMPGAEIHIVLRTHGNARDDQAERESQLTSFNGGCPEAGCTNVQASVHRSSKTVMTPSGS